VIIVPIGIYTISPLFTDTVIDEELPDTIIEQENSAEGKVNDQIQIPVNESKERESTTGNIVVNVNQYQDNNHLNKEQNNTTNTIIQLSLAGNFIGAGDGIHDAQGKGKIIPLDDGNYILRLEDYRSTN
jgi:hypothetical protein